MARRTVDSPAPLVAAARGIRLGDRKGVAEGEATLQGWQKRIPAAARVPEVNYILRFRATAMAKVELFPAVMPTGADPEDDPVPVSDERAQVRPELAAAATEELARFRAKVGGQGQLLALMCLNLDTMGEGYVVGWGPRDEERDPITNEVTRPGAEEEWQVHSVLAPERKGATYAIKRRPGDRKPAELDPERDTIFRFWNQHWLWPDLPDSHLSTLLDDCDLLGTLTRQLKAESRSRHNAGVLLVPNELGFGPADPTKHPGKDQFQVELEEALIEPVEDDGSPSQVVPLYVKGSAEHLQHLRHLLLARQSDSTVDERIDKRVMRIARGMPAPVEVATGHMATTFANAQQIDQDTYDDHLDPTVRNLCEIVRVGFLVPQLEERGFRPDEIGRLLVAPDVSGLVAQPRPADTANEGVRNNAISWRAWRRASGFSEDDAPDPVELLVRTALARGTLGDPTTLALLDLLGVDIEADPNQAEAVAEMVSALRRTAGNGNGAKAHILTAASATRARGNGTKSGRLGALGGRLADIDRELRARLMTAADGALRRAVDKAGARLRAQTSLRRTLQGVPNHMAAAHVGPLQVASAGYTPAELLEGAWDDLEGRWERLVAGAQASTRTALRRALEFTEAEDAELGRRMDDERGAAWAWMAGALTALGADLLFRPEREPGPGEVAVDTRVPPGLVRQAVARAGGATGLQAVPGRAYAVQANGGERPAGGVGTGELVRETLADHGVRTEGFRWDYGAGLREAPFAGHERLDGEEFESWTDPALSVLDEDAWIGASFYFPGDHDGCFPAGTVVSGPAPRGSTLRWYEGELVEVTFASGEFLTATPNHPILTDRGWVGAGLLNEARHVVRCLGAEGIAGLVPGDHQVPAPIEQVVDSLGVSLGVLPRAVPVASEHFHGDGGGSEVAVVRADRLLSNRRNASLGQPEGETTFSGGDADAPLLAGQRRSAQGLVGVRPPALRFVGRSHKGGPLLRRRAGVPQGLHVPHPADRYTGSEQATPNHWPADAEALSDGVLRLAAHVGLSDVGYRYLDLAPERATVGHGRPKPRRPYAVGGGSLLERLPRLVGFDRVVEIRRFRTGVHVYNLDTGVGWYTANGVIVHNCACFWSPLLGGGE